MTAPIVEFDVAPGEFLLAGAVEANPDHGFVLGSVVAGDRSLPTSLRISGEDAGRFDASLRADPTVGRFDHVATTGDTARYEVEWRLDGADPTSVLADGESEVLEAAFRGGSWRLLLRFPSRAACAAFLDRVGVRSSDAGWYVVQCYGPTPHPHRDGLTPAQREAVDVAFESGYFEIPRAVTTRDLAAKLDITPNAVSERLRRAERTLVVNALFGEE